MRTVQIGNIDISNPQLEQFLEGKSIDEIKSLFINFLNNQLDSEPVKPKHKWAEFADKMSGLIQEDTAESLIKSSKEFRNGFEFRNIST